MTLPSDRMRRGPIMVGSVFVVVGGALLLQQMGAFPEVRLATVILLALGGLLLALTVTGSRRGWFGPVALLGIGGFLLLRDLGTVSDAVSVWPIVIIVIGVAILLDAATGSRSGDRGPWR